MTHAKSEPRILAWCDSGSMMQPRELDGTLRGDVVCRSPALSGLERGEEFRCKESYIYLCFVGCGLSWLLFA